MNDPQSWERELATAGHVRITSSPGKILLLIPMALVFVAVGYWLTTSSDLTMLVVGWVSIVFGALGVGAALLQLAIPAVITVTADLIRVRRFTTTVIPWTAVEAVMHQRIHSTNLVTFLLTDEGAAQLRDSASRATRAALAANRQSFGSEQLSLPTALTASAADLAAWLAIVHARATGHRAPWTA